MTEDILIPIALFGSVFGILYVFLTTRNKERMLMIEKGADAKMFYRKPSRGFALKLGMLCIGIAIGILMGNLLHVNANMDEDISMPSMIFLFGGIALVANAIMEKKQKVNGEN